MTSSHAKARAAGAGCCCRGVVKGGLLACWPSNSLFRTSCRVYARHAVTPPPPSHCCNWCAHATIVFPSFSRCHCIHQLSLRVSSARSSNSIQQGTPLHSGRALARCGRLLARARHAPRDCRPRILDPCSNLRSCGAVRSAASRLAAGGHLWRRRHCPRRRQRWRQRRWRRRRC